MTSRQNQCHAQWLRINMAHGDPSKIASFNTAVSQALQEDRFQRLFNNMHIVLSLEQESKDLQQLINTNTDCYQMTSFEEQSVYVTIRCNQYNNILSYIQLTMLKENILYIDFSCTSKPSRRKGLSKLLRIVAITAASMANVNAIVSHAMNSSSLHLLKSLKFDTISEEEIWSSAEWQGKHKKLMLTLQIEFNAYLRKDRFAEVLNEYSYQSKGELCVRSKTA